MAGDTGEFYVAPNISREEILEMYRHRDEQYAKQKELLIPLFIGGMILGSGITMLLTGK
jgi:hypothetical protein